MPVVDSVVHLGNTLQFNLSNTLDINSKSNLSVKLIQFSSVLSVLIL